ncbi:unnamed protein product [Prorocentrum cordatum]|nr:unnamed protein product [Polarella glacialis]
MLRWLDATIQESHFEEMRSFGVGVLRVPCGYWNWVEYEEGGGPEANASVEGVPVAERLRRLHRIAHPSEYREFFDRIFLFASRHSIKVLLDLHGLPGSQNGEIHSGVCLELKKEPDEHGKTFFQTEANKATALRAVREMARYTQGKEDALFGIQVINEPHLGGDATSADGHEFLRDYYKKAIIAAREFLAPYVPVVLFEWTYNFDKWEPHAFPDHRFGSVLWDTHIYHFPEENEEWLEADGGMEKAKKAYQWDLSQLRHFSHLQGGRVFVGEFSLAGPSFFKDRLGAYSELAAWLIDQFHFASAGSLLWTYDGAATGWSMQRQVRKRWVDWGSLIGRALRDSQPSAAVRLQAEQGGGWLSAQEQGGSVHLAEDPDWWEDWVPYHYRAHGEPRLALRSAAHGTWLSADERGGVSQAPSRSAWEEFRVVAHGGVGDGPRRVSLRTFHGGWLSIEPETWLVAAPPETAGKEAKDVPGGIWIVA